MYHWLDWFRWKLIFRKVIFLMKKGRSNPFGKYFRRRRLDRMAMGGQYEGMGQQYNAVQKRRRRKLYLKRKKQNTKATAAVKS